MLNPGFTETPKLPLTELLTKTPSEMDAFGLRPTLADALRERLASGML